MKEDNDCASKFENHLNAKYEELNLSELGLDFSTYRYSMIGYYNLRASALINNSGLLSIVDFTQTSRNKRLYIVNVESNTLLHQTFVAHATNSGEEFAEHFSNVPDSNTSSLGFFVTAETYTGKHGLSLRLDGQDVGYNDNARERYIVMHGADYVSQEFIDEWGRLGRSWGCPAIENDLRDTIIPLIKERSTLFIYFDDREYLDSSIHLNLATAIKEFDREVPDELD